jgi:hypothetical protein
MKVRIMLRLALLAAALLSSACVYIVLPEGLESGQVEDAGSAARVWSGIVTNVGQSEAGDLHVDLTIRNDTGDWSTMQAVAGQPAILTQKDGSQSECETVLVGTGGHRLAPGFQMRGYTAGTKDELKTQPLYVECQDAAAAPGATLAIEYVSFGGELDDYKPEENKSEGVITLNLDEVAADLTYPVATPVEGLILEPGAEIVGLSENVVTLLDAQRAAPGFVFTWQNFNPTKFPLTTHIGTPPVIGADGILYGLYKIIDLAPVPITPPGEKIEWTTEVAVPQDGTGFYILLSVESKKPRTYLNYVIDISDK